MLTAETNQKNSKQWKILFCRGEWGQFQPNISSKPFCSELFNYNSGQNEEKTGQTSAKRRGRKGRRPQGHRLSQSPVCSSSGPTRSVETAKPLTNHGRESPRPPRAVCSAERVKIPQDPPLHTREGILVQGHWENVLGVPAKSTRQSGDTQNQFNSGGATEDDSRKQRNEPPPLEMKENSIQQVVYSNAKPNRIPNEGKAAFRTSLALEVFYKIRCNLFSVKHLYIFKMCIYVILVKDARNVTEADTIPQQRQNEHESQK